MIKAVEVRVFESIEAGGEKVVLKEDSDDITRELRRGMCFVDEILERLRAWPDQDSAYWMQNVFT